MADRVIGWTPDGTRVLFASSRESGRQRYNQFFTVGLAGGLPEKLPVPYGEFGTYSPDGTQFVYMPMSQDFRNWKRYRGGWAPDLWLFDLKTFASREHQREPGATTRSRCGTARRSISCRTAARTSATTSGRTTAGEGARR